MFLASETSRDLEQNLLDSMELSLEFAPDLGGKINLQLKFEAARLKNYSSIMASILDFYGIRQLM